MAEQGTAGSSEAARVITIERLLSEPGRGGRTRDRFERVFVTAHAYGAYRPPPSDGSPSQLPGYDLSRLNEDERSQLERLLEKARGSNGAGRRLAAGALTDGAESVGRTREPKGRDDFR
ncbi:MAG TPA: hypothetical protein VLS93_17690 [Anaeromyxobacteraceae bacterium]|nr:hypothetical protein [Anaeromyxobacteraceae bacterium]